MTALRSDFSSGKPLPASVASESAASTSASRTVAGAPTLDVAVTGRCYPGEAAPSGRGAGGGQLGRGRGRRAVARPGQPQVVRRPGPRQARVGQPDRELRVVAERVLEGGLDARVDVPAP